MKNIFFLHFRMPGEFAEIAKNDHIILLCIHSLAISKFFVINPNAVMWKLLSHNRISVWMFLWVNVRHTKIDPFYLFPSFWQRNANRWNNLFKFMWIQMKGPCNALNEKIHGKCNPLETNRKKTVHLRINFFNSTKKFHFKHVFVCLFAWQPLQRPHWITLITRFTFSNGMCLSVAFVFHCRWNLKEFAQGLYAMKLQESGDNIDFHKR